MSHRTCRARRASAYQCESFLEFRSRYPYGVNSTPSKLRPSCRKGHRPSSRCGDLESRLGSRTVSERSRGTRSRTVCSNRPRRVCLWFQGICRLRQAPVADRQKGAQLPRTPRPTCENDQTYRAQLATSNPEVVSALAEICARSKDYCPHVSNRRAILASPPRDRATTPILQ